MGLLAPPQRGRRTKGRREATTTEGDETTESREGARPRGQGEGTAPPPGTRPRTQARRQKRRQSGRRPPGRQDREGEANARPERAAAGRGGQGEAAGRRGPPRPGTAPGFGTQCGPTPGAGPFGRPPRRGRRAARVANQGSRKRTVTRWRSGRRVGPPSGGPRGGRYFGCAFGAYLLRLSQGAAFLRRLEPASRRRAGVSERPLGREVGSVFGSLHHARAYTYTPARE